MYSVSQKWLEVEWRPTFNRFSILHTCVCGLRVCLLWQWSLQRFYNCSVHVYTVCIGFLVVECRRRAVVIILCVLPFNIGDYEFLLSKWRKEWDVKDKEYKYFDVKTLSWEDTAVLMAWMKKWASPLRMAVSRWVSFVLVPVNFNIKLMLEPQQDCYTGTRTLGEFESEIA